MVHGTLLQDTLLSLMVSILSEPSQLITQEQEAQNGRHCSPTLAGPLQDGGSAVAADIRHLLRGHDVREDEDIVNHPPEIFPACRVSADAQ
jgi:hypothetical protein